MLKVQDRLGNLGLSYDYIGIYMEIKVFILTLRK